MSTDQELLGTSDSLFFPEEKPIPVNGFAQIVAMLRVADPEFRESLLRRLAQRDHRLAAALRRDLGY